MKNSCTILLACFLFSAKLYAQPSSTANIAREAEYDVKFYFLDLDIEQNNSFISGSVTSTALVVANTMDTFSVELDTVFTIDSVSSSLNGAAFQTAQVVTQNTDVNVLLPFTAQANDMVQTRISYHGTARTSVAFPNGAAFFKGNPVFSASPPYNAMTWWPCKQSLTDKADSSWFFITTDTVNTAVSNGLLADTVDIAPGKRQWQWKSHHAIDFYLVSFVVGTLTETTQYFHPAGRADSMIVEFYKYTPSPDTLVLSILQQYSGHFGLYPFYDEKFGIAQVNLSGGMENQTCVSLGASGGVVWHETMHQWFGDNVTCGSYKDLCLNEGFAHWAESFYPEIISANPDSTRISLCNGYETGALPYPGGSVYNYNTDTATVLPLYAGEGYAMNYDKGAMMINSMRFEINNDSLFFAGLKNYQTRFAASTALGSDLRDVMTASTGIDFTNFFNQWYYGYGFPVFNIKWNQVNNMMAIQVTETVSDSAQTPLFKTSLDLGITRFNDGTNTDTVIRLFMDTNLTQITIPMGDSVTGITVDPEQWILNGPGTSAKDTTLIVPGNVSVSSLNDNAYSVFPNPANDWLFISGHQAGNQLLHTELFNSIGQSVMKAATYPNQKIKLPQLAGGLYILRINNINSFRVVIDR